MSKLHDLITQLCPDGVPYRKLDEIAVIKKGTQLNKNMLLDDGKYPVLNGGKNYSGYWNEYNFDGKRIAISQGGASAGFVTWMEKPFWAGAHCYVIDSSKESSIRYLFHVIKSHELDYMKAQYGAGIPSLSFKTLSQTEIPLPPLPVQTEIARILDAFTELEAELEAELSDRKKQYEYFRGRLLNDKNLERMDGEPVETKKLGDVSRVFGGYAFKSKEYTVSGARVMRISDVQAGYISNENAKYCPIDQPKQADSARLFANDLLVSLTGNVGRVAMVDNTVLPAYLNQRVAGLRATDAINYRFLFHYLNQHQFIADCERAGKGSAQKNLSMGYLTNYEIPVPSLATQERVVDILDRFDALTTSLTDGIPAEIAMRREQYEYYRSRLLDFPRLPEDAVSDGNVE